MVQHLMECVPSDVWEKIQDVIPETGSDFCHQSIVDLLSKTVLFGGKRLRPLLTHIIGHGLGLSSNEVQLYAKSIEQVHAASLAHDDVIDRASTRRGRPSINSVADNKKAVLGGDYLLATVIEDLTAGGSIRLTQEMASIIKQLAVGEWLQWESIETREYSEEIIQKIAESKTASVMTWCGLAPALLAKLDEQEVHHWKSFGRDLGLAFQYIDDCLDFSETSEKDFGLDMENNQLNMVTFKLLHKKPDLWERFKGGENLLPLVEKCRREEIQSAALEVRELALNHLNSARRLLKGALSLHLSEDGIKNLELILQTLEDRQS